MYLTRLTYFLADEYADAEDVLGQWFAMNPEKRKDIVLGTKFGIQSDPQARGKFKVDSSPEYCRQAIEKSLSRLGVSYIDIYYIHRLDKVTPIEKTMEALVQLKEEGKIKYIGLSECSASSIRRAHAVHPVTCIQVEYNLFCTVIETPGIAVLDTARELGIGVIAYGPLAAGILSGTLRTREDFSKPGDLRGMVPQLREENMENTVTIVDNVSKVAKRMGITTGQLALAWLLSQGDDIFPIPGTTKADRLRENLESMSIHISQEVNDELRQLVKGIRGGRVQDMLGFSFGDTPPLQ